MPPRDGFRKRYLNIIIIYYTLSGGVTGGLWFNYIFLVSFSSIENELKNPILLFMEIFSGMISEPRPTVVQVYFYCLRDRFFFSSAPKIDGFRGLSFLYGSD